MKKYCLLIVSLLFGLLVYSVELSWEFYYGEDGIPFDTLRIYAIKDAALDGASVVGPWANDGVPTGSVVPSDGDIYIGYSSPDGNAIIKLKELPYPANDPEARYGHAYGESTLFLNGYEDSLFYIETLASGKVVGYTELSTYDDLRPAFMTDESGERIYYHSTWMPTAHAIPEPSSGLLLLIGGALVGLRRKRRVA